MKAAMQNLILTLLVTLVSMGCLAETEKSFHVVIGSFGSEAAAESARQRNSYQRDLSIVLANVNDNQATWRLLSGPFKSYDAADRERESLGRLGVIAPWILDEHAQPGLATAPVPEMDRERERATVKRSMPMDLSRGVFLQPSPEVLRRAANRQALGPGPLLPESKAQLSDRVSQLQRIEVSDIQIRGSQLLSNELETLISPYRGRSLSMEALLGLRDEANRLFVTNGFINSGVVIPDQPVISGLIYFDAIEGEIDRIKVSSDLAETYVRNRLRTEAPFNLKDLQMSLKLLEKNPLVERVNARIVPGDELGLADLELSVDAAKAYRIGVLAANNRSPGIGENYGELYFGADNLTGLGDSLYLSAALTRGMDSVEAHYSIPFNSKDYRFIAAYSRNDADAVETLLDINSLTESSKIGLVMPVIRTLNSELSVEVSAEKRRNATTLFGTSFSFAEGAINGESRVAPVRIGVSYVLQGLSQSFAGRLVVSKGTSSFNATEQPSGPDGDFLSVLGQLQYSRQLGVNFHVTGKLLAQYAADPLLAIEKVAVGGMDTVRGYRENQIVRDNVYLASIEGRYRTPLKAVNLQLVTFLDWGSGKNHKDAASSQTDTLSSIGIGVNIRAFEHLSANIYFAHGFKDVVVVNRKLQDDGIHFRLNYEYRF